MDYKRYVWRHAWHVLAHKTLGEGDRTLVAIGAAAAVNYAAQLQKQV